MPLSAVLPLSTGEGIQPTDQRYPVPLTEGYKFLWMYEYNYSYAVACGMGISGAYLQFFLHLRRRYGEKWRA